MNFNPGILQMNYQKLCGLHRCWKPCRWIYRSFLKLYSYSALALNQQIISNYTLDFTKQPHYLYVQNQYIWRQHRYIFL